MGVKLEIRERVGVTIVDVSGKLMLGEGTHTFRKKLEDLIASGSRRILLNLADVTYLDSSGAGQLVASFLDVQRSGGEMKLLNLSTRAHDLLKITRLCTVFETFDDESAAIASFTPAPPTELQLRWAEFMTTITGHVAHR